MPLPLANTAWPPVAVAPAIERMQEHDAWLSGDVATLEMIYGAFAHQTQVRKADKSPTGGVLSIIQRRLGFIPFWGTKLRTATVQTNRTVLHIPVAADIAAMKSDLLWAEPPNFAAQTLTTSGYTDAPTNVQGSLDAILNQDTAHMMLSEAGTLNSALGGTYYRATWNTMYVDHICVEAVDGDAAVPEYVGDRLVAVNFWESWLDENDDSVVWRHIERHEPGFIIHALYRGRSDNIGVQTTLNMQQEAVGDIMNIPGAVLDGFTVAIPTGIQRLTVSYEPNAMKNYDFRKTGGILRRFGRSDYAGQEAVLSDLDMAWSSYMFDIVAGKSRIFVPENALNIEGPGKAATWDPAQEVYAQLNVLDLKMQGMVQAQQFPIRWMEHEAAILALTKTALRGAGLGTRDYDATGEGSGRLTATGELERNKREETTRDTKKRYASAALGYIASVALELTPLVFRGRPGGAGLTVKLEFPEQQQADPTVDATVIGLLDTARAISLEQKVRRANPEWSDAEVMTEVGKIKADQQSVVQAMQNTPAADPNPLDPKAMLQKPAIRGPLSAPKPPRP